MSWIAFIRHGPTAWNAEGRIQGRSDVVLSDAGRAEVARWRVPPQWRTELCLTSPLQRARETAALLGFEQARAEPALTEMNWGEWEGATLAQLRRGLGARMRENESRGLDLQPPGGESPRLVRRRLHGLLERLASLERPVVAVTHKGVIRAALSWATDWNMCAEPPVKLRWDCAHVFELLPGGRLRNRCLNMPLAPGAREHEPPRDG